MNLPRAAVSILKVIDQATSQSRLCRLHSFHPTADHKKCIRRPKMEFVENKARNGNWSDRILGSPRILGVQRWITGYQAAAPNTRSLGVENQHGSCPTSANNILSTASFY